MREKSRDAETIPAEQGICCDCGGNRDRHRGGRLRGLFFDLELDLRVRSARRSR